MKVACIGAGTVGHAWAVVFARAGFSVALYDVAPGQVERHSIPLARETLQLLERHGLLTEPIDTVVERIAPTATIEDAVADADYVQESAKEDLAVKRQIFTQAAAAAPPNAILASSTSAIPGSDFLTDIVNPERALVAHPVNPPSLIPLVELCATKWTSPDTLAGAKKLMTEIGMKPITVLKEIDGFVLNRLQFTLVAEALHLVGEGYCSAEDIDTVMTEGLALRWASIGPFEVAHLNAPDGFAGFVARLGEMMRRLGADARTDYPWTAELVASLHADLAARVPIEEIPARQAWRNDRILALKKLKSTPGS